jgi:hypothetical protein
MENSLVIQKTEKNLSTGITLTLFTDNQPNKEIIKQVEKDLKKLAKLFLQVPNFRLAVFPALFTESIYDNIDITTFNFLAKKYNCKPDMRKINNNTIYYYISIDIIGSTNGNGGYLSLESEKITMQFN